MFYYRVKNMEPFKDGNVLGGRFIKAGEVLIVTEDEKAKLVQSGAALEVLETLVKNPLKALAEEVEQKVYVEETVEEQEQPAPKRRGRPRKNA